MKLFPALPFVLCLLPTLPSSAQVDAVLGIDDARLRGTNAQGQVFLNTPDPTSAGSSVVHWDPTATPNLLMEPAVHTDLLHEELDLTVGLMRDVGWNLGNMSFNLMVGDRADTGFNDPTPFEGAPGNDASTLGEARRNVFEAAFGVWGRTLASNVEVNVLAAWIPLTCGEDGAALAGAAPTFHVRDASFLPEDDTWYPIALAEALAGEPVDGPSEDVEMVVNVSIDEACLGEGTGFYYGLDGNAPEGKTDLLPVILHEIAHGLGMTTTTSAASGGGEREGSPSVYDRRVYDTRAERSWDRMSNAQRAASAINVRHVVWSGEAVTADAPDFLEGGTPELEVASPPFLAGAYEVGTALYGPELTSAGISGELACMEPADGCAAATNAADLEGKIALVDRGTCFFVDKTRNAEAAGAAGVVVVNTEGNTPINLAGEDDSVAIPTVAVGRDDGELLRAEACKNIPAGSLLLNDNRFLVSASWRTNSGATGDGTGVKLTDDSGYFYFFGPKNIELVVKVLNACNQPAGKFWVFAAGLTNVEVTLTVTDQVSGETKEYKNPLGSPFQPVQDTAAFDTCDV